MTVHILTKQTRLESHVRVIAPPGERPERVAEAAMLQVDAAREQMGLIAPATELRVSTPKYYDGRKWHVHIIYTVITSEMVEV